MLTRKFLEKTGVANTFVLAVIAILLAVIAWTQVSSPAIEATQGIVITYHPEVNSVCLSSTTVLICDHWWKFIEPGSSLSREDAWNSIFGDLH